MDALAWCRDRMLAPGQALTASLPFAAAEDQDAILSIRTVGAELLALGEGSPEASLLQARVDWWLGALAGKAAHPALAALDLALPDGRVAATDFAPVLVCLTRHGVQPRFERYEEFLALGQATAGHVTRLESRLHASATDPEDRAADIGTASWILRRIRDIAQDARLNRWLLPLDLQAQFQIARQDVVAARGGPGWQGLVHTLVARALELGDQAAAALQPTHRHLLVNWAVQKRLAARLLARPDAILRRRLLPGHAGNVWVAWRAARRLHKAASGSGKARAGFPPRH